jgi:hypothetical protein
VVVVFPASICAIIPILRVLAKKSPFIENNLSVILYHL